MNYRVYFVTGPTGGTGSEVVSNVSSVKVNDTSRIVTLYVEDGYPGGIFPMENVKGIVRLEDD